MISVARLPRTTVRRLAKARPATDRSAEVLPEQDVRALPDEDLRALPRKDFSALPVCGGVRPSASQRALAQRRR